MARARLALRLSTVLALGLPWLPSRFASTQQATQGPVLTERPSDVESMAIPSASRAELKLVRRARALLSSTTSWNHRDGGTCPPQASSFSIYCALESAAHPGVDADAVRQAQQEARLVVWDLVVSKEYDHPLTDYNNDTMTTFADVQRLFRWLETRVQIRLGRSAAVAASGTREDDSQAEPPATASDLEIVREARRLLASADRWNEHDTRDCPAGARTFSFYCALVEASDRVVGNLEQRGAAMQDARFVVDELAGGRKFPHRLMDFNNDPATGYPGVQEALRLLEQRVRRRVEARK